MRPLVRSVGTQRPQLADSAWVAPGAVAVGEVRMAAESSAWYGAVLRGDGASIDVGPRTNLQDGVVVHVDPNFPVHLGAGVSVGHRAVLHGCSVDDDCLIGMGAIVLNGARVGAGSLVAAGAVVRERAVVPPRSLVAGVPGKVVRNVSDEEFESIVANATQYVELLRQHRIAT